MANNNPALLKNRANNQKTYNKEALDLLFNETIGLPEYDEDTRELLFTRKNGATFTVTLPVLDMPFKLEIDDVNKEIVFKFEDNSVKRVPMSELLISYEGTTGDQIQVIVDPNEAEISAILLNNSVTEAKLHPTLASKLGDIWEVEEL